MRHARHLLLSALLFSAAASRAQEPAPAPAPVPEGQTTPGQAQQPPAGRGWRSEDGQGRPVLGIIKSIGNGAMELTTRDDVVTVKITDKTEFRKDRQPAKLADFKAGDGVMVRGEKSADHTVTAVLIAGRSGNGPGGEFFAQGELGKDYVAGEVKSVDAPKITVLRPDNVTQTIELDENTSLHRGRESITMADVQPGDHLFARGALQNNQFVPKNVMVLSAEQWKRMQEMGMGGRANAGTAPADAPKSGPPQR
jgi:Domain of unknown function (DUF5666)